LKRERSGAAEVKKTALPDLKEASPFSGVAASARGANGHFPKISELFSA
jgi:hypothetical protein